MTSQSIFDSSSQMQEALKEAAEQNKMASVRSKKWGNKEPILVSPSLP